MEPYLVEQLTDDVVGTGAARFGVSSDQLTPCHGSMNVVYEYQKSETSCILRFTPLAHRSVNMVRGEVAWLRYLANRGVPVSPPIPTHTGRYVVMVPQGFAVTAFVKAPGDPVTYPDCLHDHDLYYHCGQTLGRLHAASVSYVPASSTVRRSEWRENFYLRHIRDFVLCHEDPVFSRVPDIIARLDRLPRTVGSFGLTHGDVHVGNLRRDGAKITLFDFDDAQYSWFLDDIVTLMYYLVYVYGGEENRPLRESQARRFLAHFLCGYRETFTFDDRWMIFIPLFLQLREIIVYVGMYKNHPGMSNLNPWGRDFMGEARQRIAQGEPIVDLWS